MVPTKISEVSKLLQWPLSFKADDTNKWMERYGQYLVKATTFDACMTFIWVCSPGFALEVMIGGILLSTQSNTKLPAMPQFCISHSQQEELRGLNFFWNKIAFIWVCPLGFALEVMIGGILVSTQSNTKLPAMPQFCLPQGQREELRRLNLFWNKIAFIWVCPPGFALEVMIGAILLSTQNNTKLPAMAQFCIFQGQREELRGLNFFWN